MADALAAREQRVGELLDRHAGVAVHVLEPFGGIARGVLDLQHLDAAVRLIGSKRFVHAGARGLGLAELARQVDGVFHRQLGAAADGKVRRVRRVAHQHDGHAPALDGFVVHPGVADHAREADPDGRAAQVFGVADQAMAVQVPGEQLLAKGDALFLAHLVEAVGLPDRLGRLDDEGGSVVVELVGMGLEPAVLGLFEGEGEGVEGLFGAEPDEAAAARVDVGLEHVFVARADAAVEAVAGNHQVGAVLGGQRALVGHVGLEHQFNPQGAAAVLQDAQQVHAPDAAEAVAGGTHAAALVEDLDVVPVVEGVADQARALGVGHAQVLQRLVRQHHAPAEGVVGPVALDHHHPAAGPLFLQQQAEVQARRATADAQDAGQVVHVDII